jgi:NAD(P)H-quinone oxidoreductase subunit 5
VPIYLASVLTVGPLLVGAVVGFMNTGRRPKLLPNCAEVASLLALLAAVVSGIGLVLSGPGDSPLLGLRGVGLSVRLDAVSAVMLLLVRPSR